MLIMGSDAYVVATACGLMGWHKVAAGVEDVLGEPAMKVDCIAWHERARDATVHLHHSDQCIRQSV